jgi:prolyl 4-hydroxylase
MTEHPELVPSVPIVQLTGFVVSVDPKITLIPKFLTASECDHLIGLGETSGFSQSLVGRGKGTEYESHRSEALANTVSVNRTSFSYTIPTHHSDSILALIEDRLSQVVHLPVTHLESLVIVKYDPGQFFRCHHDGSFRPYTVFIYLNDIDRECGGETRFENLGIRIRPRMGLAVMWPNTKEENGEQVADERLVHEALPPTNSVKYGVNCFFNERIIRERYFQDNKGVIQYILDESKKI